MGKSLGTDLANGKMTLPLLILRDALEEEQRKLLLEMIAVDDGQRPGTEVQAQLNRWLEDQQIFRQVQERAEQSIADSIEALHLAAPKCLARDRLEELARFVVQREL